MTKKMKFQIFVNLIGMSGFAIGPMTLMIDLRSHPGHWEEHYEQLEILKIKCVNVHLSLTES